MNIRCNQYSNRQLRIDAGLYDEEFYRDYNYEKTKYFQINQYPSERKPDYYRWYFKDRDMYNPVSYRFTSRYTKVKTMKELGKTYHSTNRVRGIPYSKKDVTYVVNNTSANRLDLISTIYYNDPRYWWIIAHANNIFDAFTEIPRGTKLRIPPLDSIKGLYI